MRIRTIKPEFWSHPVLARQSDAVRLMAIGLLTYADDEGYFSSDETLVRNALRPFDQNSGNSLESLRSLSSIGFIELCQHPSRGPIGRVVNFCKHQKISHPTSSRLATYWTLENIRNDSGKTPEPLRPDQGSRDQGSRDQGNEGAGGVGDSALPPQSPPAPRSKRFIPPTITQVAEYCLSNNLDAEADAFVDHFTSNGWKVSGKTPMADWKAAARNWARRGGSFARPAVNQGKTQAEHDTAMEAHARNMCQS